LRIIPWAVLVLAACSDPASPGVDLRVTTTVTPSVFRTGERATVTTTVTNRGDRSWDIAAPGCGTVYQVQGPNGPIYFEGATCLAAARALIAPGQRLEFTETLWETIPPGNYQVRSFVQKDAYSPWVRIAIKP
jgi:hypothetical protein